MDDIAKTGVAAQELTQFVERVERLEEEKEAISDDIRAVYAWQRLRPGLHWPVTHPSAWDIAL